MVSRYYLSCIYSKLSFLKDHHANIVSSLNKNVASTFYHKIVNLILKLVWNVNFEPGMLFVEAWNMSNKFNIGSQRFCQSNQFIQIFHQFLFGKNTNRLWFPNDTLSILQSTFSQVINENKALPYQCMRSLLINQSSNFAF